MLCLQKKTIIPPSYVPLLDRRETQRAVRLVRQSFASKLCEALTLTWVAAPLFVEAGTGINDDLNGVEMPVPFRARGVGEQQLEVVQSLAKWKRLTLAELEMRPGEGIYADLAAIRPDEDLDPLHSVCVDQWEWESVLADGDRCLTFLKRIVREIFLALRATEETVRQAYPEIDTLLPARITFVHAEDLEERYPTLTPEEREDRIALEHGAVFVIGVGGSLRSGEPHDARAPDYDDWTTPNGRGRGLNGDLVVWNPVLERSMELSSMGIRVSPEVLLRQLEIRDCCERRHLDFHRGLLDGRLPLSIGGGIGQSRVCMYLLRKAHIGEVQCSVWPDVVRQECLERRIPLL